MIADTASVTPLIPTLAQLYQPQISGAPATFAMWPSVWSAFTVPVTNLGMAPVTYHMTATVTGGYQLHPI